MHDEVIAEFRPKAEAALDFVDNTVKDQPFLLGDRCTIADIGCLGRMVFMAEGGLEIGRWLHRTTRLRNKTAFPAKAGIHRSSAPPADRWVPAFAGNAVYRKAIRY